MTSRDLKHRVFTSINKLSDRDTYVAGAAELESIAVKLTPESFSVFISCVQSTSTADKSAVRKQCVKLFGVLAEAHGDALTAHLTKMLTSLVRRLRDPDTSVRSVCVDVVGIMAERISKAPFSVFVKVLTEAMFTETDMNAQIGAALCLAAAIERSVDLDVSVLRRLLPRFERLLKVDSYKGKSAVMAVIGSVVEVRCGLSLSGVRSLVPCLVGFLGSEEWAVRKAAAEGLGKLAVAERDLLSEFKVSCLKTFEKKRYDKVKAVRETMNQMLDAWKEVPDLEDQDSPPPVSPSSSKENGSGQRLLGSRSSFRKTPEVIRSKRQFTSRRSSPADGSVLTTAKKRSPIKSSTTNMVEGTQRKTENKPWKIELSVPCGTSTESCKKSFGRKDEILIERGTEKVRLLKPGTRRGLFTKNSDDTLHKIGFVKSSSVAPYDEIPEPATVARKNVEGINQFHRDDDELTSIKTQLKQIESQQSDLMELLHKFIGSSQTGIQTLETRVQGLEVALNGITHSLAESSKSPSSFATNALRPAPTCCMFPGTNFLSSKFLRKTKVQEPVSRFSKTRVSSPLSSLRFLRSKKRSPQAPQMQSPVFQLNGGGGFIVNPLAEIQTDPFGILGASSSNHISTIGSSGATGMSIIGARRATLLYSRSTC